MKERSEKDALNSKKATTMVTNDDRNWMQSFKSTSGNAPAMPERPMTASTQNARVREVQEELKKERKEKNKLFEQVENLKNEI